ncbi:MAG: VanZ family protein [Clostridia bacterium]|nr:VanZ family protein [Clostridia bacterium]
MKQNRRRNHFHHTDEASIVHSNIKGSIGTQATVRQTIATILNIVILLALLVFIFGHSMQNQAASAQESLGVLAVLSDFMNFIFGHSNLTDHIVRKLAHFSEFAALGFFTIHLCRVRRQIHWHSILHSLFFGLLCALTDESIQLFNDRSSQVSDVWIDFSGVCCGILFFLLLYSIHRLWKKHTPT